jgi:hypothetical protein
VGDWGDSRRAARKMSHAEGLGLAVVLHIPVGLMADRGVKELNAKATNVGNTSIDFT